MADTCPRCGREKAESFDEWRLAHIAADRAGKPGRQLCAHDHKGYSAFADQRAECDELTIARLERSRPDDIRARGWVVAVHNDYQLNGEPHTFWLFTNPDGRWLKGEGRTDEEALEQVRHAAR